MTMEVAAKNGTLLRIIPIRVLIQWGKYIDVLVMKTNRVSFDRGMIFDL